MMSAKLVTLGLLIIKVIMNKGYHKYIIREEYACKERKSSSSPRLQFISHGRSRSKRQFLNVSDINL